MAEKATPDKFTYNPGAGSRAGGGGGDGDGGGDRDRAAAPSPAQRSDPSSPPRSPSPPEPFTYDPAEGSSGGGGDPGPAPSPAPRPDPSSSTPAPFTYNPSAGSSGGGARAAPTPPARQPEPSSSQPLPPSSFDDEDYVDLENDEEYKELCELELELGRRSGLGSLFMSDPQNLAQDICHYIGRQDCEALSTLEFFSLRNNWQQLLDGKKTYLRPPRNNSAPGPNYDDFSFKPPRPLQRTVECQEPLSLLIRAAAGKPIIQQKFKILSEHYVCYRRTRKDGSQFYRAFLFSYLENLGTMQGSQAEVSRLTECLTRSRENFSLLQWNNAYFSNPEAFFSSVVSEFEHLVNSVANGLNADDLYKRCLQEITSSRSYILSLLRLLTEVHIRTNEAIYKSAFGPQENALLFCIRYVRPFDTEAGLVQMRALTHALGIPLHLSTCGQYLDKDKWKCATKVLGLLASIRIKSKQIFWTSQVNQKLPSVQCN